MSNCRFCHKTLSKEKGEEDHGFLDCHGYIYIVNKVNVCFHCIENDNKQLRSENTQYKRVVTELLADLDSLSLGLDERNRVIEMQLEDKRKLKREIEVLRLYGNKDCTAMADEVLENE